MRRPRFIEHSLQTRLFAAGLLVVGAWAAWVAWGRFRHVGGADFKSGVVQSFLEARFAALSGGVYHVKLGQVSFDLEHQGAWVDSAVITTDTAANLLRVHPLPIINAVLREAQVRGVVQDGDGKGLAIEEIRFGRVDADLTFAPPDTEPAPFANAPPDSGPPMVSWTFQMPVGAPQIRIGRIILQGVTAVVHPAPGTGGRVQRVQHLSLVLDSVRLDPRVEGLRVPIVVHDIRLAVTDYTGGWDSVSTISVGSLQGSFRDSTLSGSALGLTPVRSIAQVFRRGHQRRERFTLMVDSVAARGVDWTAAVSDGAIPLRFLRVTGAHLLIFTDQRLAGRPTPRPRVPILQETLRRFGRPIALDTVEVRNSRIQYQVRAAERDWIGEIDFEEVNARLTGLRWRPDARSANTAVLTLQTKLWNVAPMTLVVRGPLGSMTPRADVELTVGAMPITMANAIVPAIDPFAIKSGMLDSVKVFIALDGDHATGEALPFYRDLAVKGRSNGGFFARLARGASEVIANSFVVRDDNPGRGGVMMVGTIDYTRDPWQTFWPFAWNAARGALAQVGKGKGVELRP
jgi:hypothetical protein